MKQFERLLEQMVIRTRWLLVPIFLGLGAVIPLLVVKYFQQFYHLVLETRHATEENFTVAVLGLLDSALLASLVVMVLISGYESSVSKLQVGEDQAELSWLGKVDATALKVKIATSIAVISALHLLKNYLDDDSVVSPRFWRLEVGLLGFAVFALLMAITDNIAHKKHH
ncbi:MAG: YqhA family protein [Polyangiales bacterium]